jgi:MFS family permease
MPEILRSLRHRNYRLYFSGQVASLTGTWMQQIAMSWLVYRLTGSVLLLGIVAFAGQIPVLLVAPLGGLIADRADRRKLLLATQATALGQSLVLAVLTFSAAIAPWHLVALALLLGTCNAIDIPARQSYFVHLIGRREDLPNAIALNSFAINGARLVGPALAGAVVAALGEAICFLLNSLSYLAMLAALMAIRTPPMPVARPGARRALTEGFRYAFGTPAARGLLALVAGTSFAATPYSVLMPAYAKEIFGGDAGAYGLLMASAGAGAVIGTIALAARTGVRGLDHVLAAAPFALAAGLLAFVAAPTIWIAPACLLVVGFAVVTIAAGANTAIQSIVPDEIRGRVMSVFTMCFLGIAPLGALAAGAVAQRIGLRATLTLGAALTLVAGLAFLRDRQQVASAMAQADTGRG